jgi:alkylation response protein AidB-like acyl-CoA dehydrogenase
MAQGAYDAALRYSKLRRQFNRPISEFQAIQHKLVDMAIDLDAARLLNYRASDMRTIHESLALALAGHAPQLVIATL